MKQLHPLAQPRESPRHSRIPNCHPGRRDEPPVKPPRDHEKPVLSTLDVPKKDARSVFDRIAGDAAGAGADTISFSEFCDWAICNGLDLDDDDDQALDAAAKEGLK